MRQIHAIEQTVAKEEDLLYILQISAGN